MALTRDMIEEYLEAKEELRTAKAKEIKLRNAIIGSFRFIEMEGVQKRYYEDDEGEVELKIILKLARTLDKDAVESLWQSFTNDERGVVKTSYSLITKDYKELAEDDGVGKLLQAVTEKPAQAALAIKINDN